jgi:hypothetical protein
MRRFGIPLCALALLALGGTALAQALPTLTAGAPPSAGNIVADPALTLTITEPTEVIFDAVATGVDAQLRLTRDGSYVAEDSDSGEGTNARLAQFLAPGTYSLIVYEYQYRAMTATVTAVVAPAMTAAATIATGAPPATIVTPEGDWARAATSEVALTVATPGNYTLTAATTDTACSPEIVVVHDHAVDGWAITAPGSGQPATAVRALQAGSYALRIRNWYGHACAMTVTAAPAP